MVGLIGRPTLPGPLPSLKLNATTKNGTVNLADLVRTAPSTTKKTATAPAARTVVNTGPSEAELAAQRAAQEQAAAQARARTQANNSARSSANQDLERLNAQITANLARKATNDRSIAALKGLVEGGHQKVRDNALSALDRALSDKLARLRETFDTSLGEFQKNLRDNEASEHDATFANLANRARERQDVVSQALSMGAGESDVLKTQLQALRNWSANQSDVNRSFFDTQTSVTGAITDLNNSTRSGMMNEEMSTNSAKAQRYDEYFNAMSQTFSELANLDQQNYLLQSEIDATEKQKASSTGLLEWLDAGKNAEDWTPPKLNATAAAKPAAYTSPYAQKAAEQASSMWKDPGISEATKNFQGWQAQTGGLNTASPWAAQQNPGAATKKRPEGATLRRW